MSSSVAAFDKTIEKTNVWLNELEGILAWDDREHAYHALRAVLHTVRDRLPPEEAVDLGAQLPHGERDQVRRALPAGVRELWAEPSL